jgi:hypothetical protein
MEWIAPIIFLVIFNWLWIRWLDKRQEKKRIRQSDPLTDENVLKSQTEFERRLDDNADSPDGIVWRRAYIYRQLMRKWFAALIAQHRRDDAMSLKLKIDWLNYLNLLERQSTGSVSEFESIDKEKQESYDKESWQMRQQYMAIENGFAAAIGEEATAELQRIRAARHSSFDRSGRKPMAPEGFRYSPVSLEPYEEELKPR